MGYSFTSSDEDLTDAVRRIAVEQIDSGLSEADDGDLSLAERIHQVRKRCKKLRGLIRLVRPAFPAYAEENAVLRDAARRLSDVRDAAALVETCAAVEAHFGDQLSADAFATLRTRLTEEARVREAAPDVADRLDATCEDLRRTRERAASWTLTASGTEALTGGLAKTHARARDAMKAAQDDPDGEVLHDWRKRVKYHWYHLRLLKRTSPLVETAVGLADTLSDALGDHHDLHVMSGTLDELAGEVDGAEIEAFRGLLAARQAELEARAFLLGRALLCETPKAHRRRIGTYWEVWREGSEAA